MIDCIEVPTPVGAMLLASDGGALCGAWFLGQKYFPLSQDWRRRTNEVLEKAASELELYFAGKSRRFSVPLAPRGTPFQEKVWKCISEIEYGKVLTYGEAARQLQSGPRAVGAATGRNPVSIFIPCHRMVGRGGLTGYAGGLEKKKALLTLEGASLRFAL